MKKFLFILNSNQLSHKMLVNKLISVLIFLFNFVSKVHPTTTIPPKRLYKNRLNSDPSSNVRSCRLNRVLVWEIASYSKVANQIFETVISGKFKGKTYSELGYFVDRFGPRFSGTQTLEDSIDFMLDKMTKDGLENVHGERVRIPHWIRGVETATMIAPRKKNIALFGLGLSVAMQPLNGITAEVLVVKSLNELTQKSKEVKGKIVVFNQFDEIAQMSLVFHNISNSKASSYGALAVLFRTQTTESINNPQAAVQFYTPNVRKIPSAMITLEDSEMFQRIQDRGEKITMKLVMREQNLVSTTSRNTVGEITGREKPDEVVIVSGHLDSWDVGQGAIDDGGGVFITEVALSVLKYLNLRPRRTLRAIYWTAEELGIYGAASYVKRHKNELGNISAVFESDSGTFKPLGLDFVGGDMAGCMVQEILKLLKPVNATSFQKLADVTNTDVSEFIKEGVPAVLLNAENVRYDWFAHTPGDTMTVPNSEELDQCTAVWAVASYVMADLSIPLPRT